MQQEDFRGQMPLFYGHINPYGRLLLNMLERIIIEYKFTWPQVTATLLLGLLARDPKKWREDHKL
jgi:hypothetical protein